MHVAEARYTGQMRSATRRLPDGSRITLRRYTEPGDHEWRGLDSVEAAERLEDEDDIEVRWNTIGRLQALSGDLAGALSDWSYRQKQKIVGEMDEADVPGNAPEEELEQAIRDHVEDLRSEGEL